MKLEVGKYYRTREGEKVGPMRHYPDDRSHPWRSDSGAAYADDGTRWEGANQPDSIIIAEWSDEPAAPKPSATGPVRTVTRKEIVPGVYGKIEVESRVGGVRIEMQEQFYCDQNVAELRAAIATLTEIADALEYAACGGELAG